MLTTFLLTSLAWNLTCYLLQHNPGKTFETASAGENRSPEPHHRGTAADGFPPVLAHAHGKLGKLDGELLLELIAQVSQPAEATPPDPGILAERRDGHQPLHLDPRQG